MYTLIFIKYHETFFAKLIHLFNDSISILGIFGEVLGIITLISQ
jgi:hypothetical protein